MKLNKNNKETLIFTKRFGPLFSAQFFGAFNDNFFKQSLTLWWIFGIGQAAAPSESEAGIFANVAAGLFILPFFLFSALAGQLSDKYDKSKVLAYSKFLEIIVMSLAVLGFYWQNAAILLVVLFCMGAQSTFFGPAKYSSLPELLDPHELMTGNALLEASTFLAILLGVVAGGFLIGHNVWLLSGGVVAVAVVGWLFSLKIPTLSPARPELTISWNLWRETLHTLALGKRRRSVFFALLGISWLWLMGSFLLAQIPTLAKHLLAGDHETATWLIFSFIVGIAAGSYGVAHFARGRLRMRWVPKSAACMAVLFVVLAFITNPYWLVLVLTLIGVASSFYVIPLYTWMQVRTATQYRARVVAANNILNSLFMVGGALITVLLYALGAKTPWLFVLIGILNGVVFWIARKNILVRRIAY